MFALILDNTVAALSETTPIVGSGECALTVSCDDTVQVGWSWTPEGCTAPPETTLTEATTAKQTEITNGAESALASLKAEYCATEITTWDQQFDEAKAVTADTSASTPLLTAIATARGQTIAVLAAKIIANRASWVVTAGSVVGQRLAYQDKLDACATVAEVQAITVSYTLPES